MLSYIYPTVFGRNAANLTQLLPKASKIRNRNDNFKKISLTCVGAFEKMFLGTFSAYTALTITNNSVETSVKLVVPLNNNFYFSHFSMN
jgi:hypothetical protein